MSNALDQAIAAAKAKSEQADEDFAESHRFDNVGDKLVGVVNMVRPQAYPDQYNAGEHIAVIEITTPDGTWAVHGLGAVLRNEFKDLISKGIAPGWEISVERVADGYSKTYKRDFPKYIVAAVPSTDTAPAPAADKADEQRPFTDDEETFR